MLRICGFLLFFKYGAHTCELKIKHIPSINTMQYKLYRKTSWCSTENTVSLFSLSKTYKSIYVALINKLALPDNIIDRSRIAGEGLNNGE